MATLAPLLKSLQIPTDFTRYDEVNPEEHLVLEEWVVRASQILKDVERILAREQQKRAEQEMVHGRADSEVGEEAKSGQGEPASELDISQRAAVIAAVVPFAVDFAVLNAIDEEGQPSPVHNEEQDILHSQSPWASPASRNTAKDILSRYFTHTDNLPKHILVHTVKPIFLKSNPHPHLNPQTGKSIPPSRVGRPPQQGGVASVTQDFYDSEGQTWKTLVGLGALLHWCVGQTKREDYEDTWHLIIPPLMTFLDDFELQYKLWGMYATRAMLQRVPPGLLKKTGVGGLLHISLTKSLASQQSPLSPTLLRVSIAISLRLTLLTTTEGSQARFDYLCKLLGEGIITDIWTYAFDKPQIVGATLDALPGIVHALGLGCMRFLQMLIPQVIHPLTLPYARPLLPGSPPVDPFQLQLQLSSLRVLIPLIDECAPRMHHWRVTILDALGRCWVCMIVDRSSGGENTKPTSLTGQTYVKPDARLKKRTKRRRVARTDRAVDSDDAENDNDVDQQAYTLDGDEESGGLTNSAIPGKANDKDDPETQLKTLLQIACQRLANACPSVINEYQTFLKTDRHMFGDLFSGVPVDVGVDREIEV